MEGVPISDQRGLGFNHQWQKGIENEVAHLRGRTNRHGRTGTKDEVDWRERYGRVNEHNGWVPRD